MGVQSYKHPQDYHRLKQYPSYGDLTAQGFSSAVWVTEEAYEYLVLNED